ncbi:hypothetical protein [Streptomyces sp. NRRL F-5126]|nr:hypothetical protein [Streptomyces sp. NRRL F-5126]
MMTPAGRYDVDQGQAVLPRVLSWREAEWLRDALTELLVPTPVGMSP